MTLIWVGVAVVLGLGRPVQAVLLGGYFGAWAAIDEVWALPIEPQSLRARGLTFGCGVVHFLADGDGREAIEYLHRVVRAGRKTEGRGFLDLC